ncbi:MAG TPA: CcoQ/FixQ family Cbb3-type cytochrome c oxidase assembly chaperone [Cytophagales bacterium]|nr:CcoQ/FixQ family Cbb3-type cytochrome c oxidase assembly chaperone [Cytophagales bacterium]
MYKDILNNIDNIAIWPTISFVIFFVFFIVLIWWVYTTDKSYISKMSNKPFEDGVNTDNKQGLKI